MLAAITIILNMVCRSYKRNSTRNSNNIYWVEICLDSLMNILLNVTIWEFSWQLFNVSVEVDEKICRTKHKLTKRVRKVVEIVVVVLIGISFIFSAYW
jgi:hypothetical protein